MNTDIFQKHHFELSEQETKRFEDFLKLFAEYNAHTNLSAIRDEDEIVEKHFVDSLYGSMVIDDFFHDEPIKILDIGSGGGFPGIPLKIIFPHVEVTLLDSVGKKVRAMNFFVENLGLEGIEAIQERAENLAKSPDHAGKYDLVVSRATAYITDILVWAKPFLREGGKILLYKMPSDEEKKDRRKIMKKLDLHLDAEFEYILAEKERILYVFSQRSLTT